MKIPQPKHLFRIITIALLLISGLIINSCRKDNKYSTQNLMPDVTQAKAWYESSFPVNSNSNSKLITQTVNGVNVVVPNLSQLITPDWQHPATYSRLGSNVIEMPLGNNGSIVMALSNQPGGKAVYKNAYSRSSFLLLKDSTGYNAYVMTIIADSAYLKNDLTKLDHNKYNKHDIDFSGVVLYFTPKGKFVSGWFYKNGSISGALSSTQTTYVITNTPGNGLVTQSLQTNELSSVTTCEYWYQTVTSGDFTYGPVFLDETCTTTYYNSGGGAISTGTSTSSGSSGSGSSPSNPIPCAVPSVPSEESVSNGNLTIDVVQPSPTPISGTGDGGYPPPTTTPTPCPTTTTTTKNVLPAVNDITNNVTNSCLKALITQLTSNQTIQTDVTNILRNTFGVNDQVNVTFTQADLTNTTSGKDDATTDGDQLNNLTVTFNSPVIANASQEYLMETTIHEIYHAYLDVNPSVNNALSQHLYMIQNYVNTEVQTLQKVFPNLSTHDAECLVLGGYGDLQTNNPASYNSAITAYGLSLSDIVNTNNNYKKGSSGTKC